MKLYLTVDGRQTNPQTLQQAFYVASLAANAGLRVTLKRAK